MFGGCVINLEECDCACHNSGFESMPHIAQCCYSCKKCRIRVRAGFLQAHEDNCAAPRFNCAKNPIFEKILDEMEKFRGDNA